VYNTHILEAVTLRCRLGEKHDNIFFKRMQQS
jgi:hypothetical protein